MADSMNGWLDIATLTSSDTSAMFARTEWVLVATSDGRVTEATPFYGDNALFIWICARGSNCSHPGREPEPNYLRSHVTHYQPLPAPPASQTEER